MESDAKAPVIQVTADDSDEGINGEVAYDIVLGNYNEVFEIDPINGVIYAVKSPLSENSLQREYHLRVSARDQRGEGPFTDETTVRIQIIEINRHKPRFVSPSKSTVSISENLPAGVKVLQVIAEDEDKGQNGAIQYSFKVGDKNYQENEYFAINKKSGEIISKISFDRETTDNYEVVLSAQDEGTPQPFETLQKLKIIIRDVVGSRGGREEQGMELVMSLIIGSNEQSNSVFIHHH